MIQDDQDGQKSKVLHNVLERMNKNEECFQIEFVAYKQLIFLVAWSAEVGIYKRKISRKKRRKTHFRPSKNEDSRK